MPSPFFWFFALVAVITIGMAIRFPFRPSERSLAILRPMCAATICSALAMFFLGVTNGLMALSKVFPRGIGGADAPQLWSMVTQGFAESFAPLIIAFAAVSVAWLLVAVGLRRQA